LVMAGHSRPKDGVASARLCPGHPRLPSRVDQDVDARDKPRARRRGKSFF
jgi:A/G-specific adenine glycosylase